MQMDMPGGYDEFLKRYWPQQDDLPKHERLRQAITASIADGYWVAGARLPTESEWAAETPCSLGTVQRALRSLVDDGLILRRRGRGVDLRHVKEVWLSLCVRTRPSFKVTPTWGDPSHTGSLTCFRPHKAHTRNRS